MGVNAVVDPEDRGCQLTTFLLAGCYLKESVSSISSWPPQRHMELGLKMWEGCLLNSWQSIPFMKETFRLAKIINQLM